MKTLELDKPSSEVAGLFEQAKLEDLVVRFPDGSEFMLTAIDDFDREVARTRQNKNLMAFLESRAKQEKTISLAEVKQQLGLSQ